ncbi:peptidyl-prolyl cis-trans isomerase CYP71 [Histomonas meleagridis]|uniref:peptidyl-prolyl cis-trans isomerase CYP71 n=1 Tax=Histomonas meleagridis TaxID=135588 RepID=UPI003559D90B|nr:peptidyl-prolyl cis-trans isomerase CYP71 [Histomonas meleagridis]KAH0805033.1 peptidyl-prolyl cis-trans isomerase CYP71 [Histomonas meleagridis]
MAENTEKVTFKDVLLSRLPSAEMYYRSYMHVDQVLFVTYSEQIDFFISMSIDGVIQFWHKTETDIEFVRKINTKDGPFNSFSVSHDGKYIATSSKNGRICVFDIPSFDLVSKYDFSVPDSIIVNFLHNPAIPIYELAITFSSKTTIAVIDCLEKVNNNEPPKIIREFEIHHSPITCMAHIDALNCSVSCDKEGLIEFWDSEGQTPKFDYQMKLDTDLFILAGSSLTAVSIAVSSNGKYIAICASDWCVYIFNIHSGKLVRKIRETFDPDVTYGIEPEDFNARIAAEKQYRNNFDYFSVQFDESNSIIAYPSPFGLKFINIKDGSLLRIIGRVEKHERYNSVAMLQSSMPMAILTAFDRQRIYLYTNKNPESPKRDVFNEKASKEKLQQTVQLRKTANTKWPRVATLHTVMGSIKFEMYPEECPLTVENFVTHARRGYYDNIRIHRVVRDFCIQTGDPTGTGIGGESIWGGTFEDEISPNGHTFDQPGMVGMANSGPNTNASQFFITTAPAPHLNGKHTCWGKVISGMENVHMIEIVEVDSYHHPKTEIKLVNITFS